jgi:hypothetical protein
VNEQRAHLFVVERLVMRLPVHAQRRAGVARVPVVRARVGSVLRWRLGVHGSEVGEL